MERSYDEAQDSSIFRSDPDWLAYERFWITLSLTGC
jgi:hypothetical protein